MRLQVVLPACGTNLASAISATVWVSIVQLSSGTKKVEEFRQAKAEAERQPIVHAPIVLNDGLGTFLAYCPNCPWRCDPTNDREMAESQVMQHKSA